MPVAVAVAVIVLVFGALLIFSWRQFRAGRRLGSSPARNAQSRLAASCSSAASCSGTCACAARASVRQSDTPGGYQIPQCLRQRVLATGMAQPHKGARRGFQIRWREEDRALVAARAAAMGMTMNDYLLTLVHRDEVDPNGRPQWSSATSPQDQLPGLGLTA